MQRLEPFEKKPLCDLAAYTAMTILQVKLSAQPAPRELNNNRLPIPTNSINTYLALTHYQLRNL